MIGCERKRLCRSNSKKNCCYFENSADFLCVGVTSGNVGGAPGKKGVMERMKTPRKSKINDSS